MVGCAGNTGKVVVVARVLQFSHTQVAHGWMREWFALREGETRMARMVSMNPDNFAQGGLKDDFDGTILKVEACPWDYNKSIETPVLAIAVTIQPDDEDQPFVQHYSAG